jgi:hypothetical protein
MTLLLRQARRLCSGFGSLEVVAAGGVCRGLLDDVEAPEGTGYDGQTRLVNRRTLTLATQDAIEIGLAVEQTVTIGEEDYSVRDIRKQADGLITLVTLAAVRRRVA